MAKNKSASAQSEPTIKDLQKQIAKMRREFVEFREWAQKRCKVLEDEIHLLDPAYQGPFNSDDEFDDFDEEDDSEAADGA